MSLPVHDPAAAPLIQVHANSLGKAANDNQRVWPPCDTHGRPRRALGFGLA